MIPESFTKPGFRYRLADYHGNVAIYEQTHAATDRVMGYEVLIVQWTTADATLPGGRVVPRGTPFLPGSEQWGRFAWTVRTLHEARRLIEEKDLNGRATTPPTPLAEPLPSAA